MGHLTIQDETNTLFKMYGTSHPIILHHIPETKRPTLEMFEPNVTRQHKIPTCTYFVPTFSHMHSFLLLFP